MSLETLNLSKSFGGLVAINGITLEVSDELVGLIGPNGSGKSTFINCVSGFLDPTSGTVRFADTDITALKPYEITRLGLGRTFQHPHIFDDLTVLENVMVPLLNYEKVTEHVKRKAWEKLEHVNLGEKSSTKAKQLSGGQKKLLEFTRAQVIQPQTLLLDEPFAGVHPKIRDQMTEQIQSLRNTGTDIMIVSHQIEYLLDVCERVIVFDKGQKIAEERPNEIYQNNRVIDAYLGGL